MKTQGEIEAAICEGVGRFQQEYMDVTGAKAVSLHHDISALTGEEVVLFALSGLPVFRQAKRERPSP